MQRCSESGTPLSFCGEDAGRPIEAVCLAAIGLHTLSMRPASIGPVKSLIMRTDLDALYDVICDARERGEQSVRASVMDYLRWNG